jgi:hypothetical protein
LARYRLRFLLQEFDLPRGATLLGRSSECHVTIEDPLVSRQHARIVLEGDEAIVSDLGSRNGVKVNGVTIRQPTLLQDGDRIRIGTQELVFCRVEAVKASAKTTGFLRHCAKCHLPYPQEVGQCPNCGGTESVEEDTLSGQFGPQERASWSLQLLIEVLDKALTMGRVEDAERVVRRASVQVEERIVRGEEVDGEQLSMLATAALRVALASNDPTWAAWVPQVYRRAGLVPEGAALEKLGEAGARFPEVREALGALVSHLRASERPFSDEEARQLAHLEGIRAHLASGRAVLS